MTVYGKKHASFEGYDGFVDKFKPKKTTDDCHTPPKVYDAVLGSCGRWKTSGFLFNRAVALKRRFQFVHFGIPIHAPEDMP